MIEIKEEFVGCDKWNRALRLGGSDAIVLWLAIKGHVSSHLTNGFISEEDMDTLRGAPARKTKALKVLIDCGRLNADGTRGAGLVDRVEHGYQLHDYLMHAESRERILEKRRLAQERKENWRRNATGTRSRTDQEPKRNAPRNAPVPHGRADVPNPTQPNHDPADAGSSAPDPGSSGTEIRTAPGATTVTYPPLAPTNLEEALQLPLGQRLSWLHERPDLVEYLQPDKWPEVVEVAMAFAKATGQKQLRLGRVYGAGKGDRGVHAILALLEAWSVEELQALIQRVVRGEFWRGLKSPGLTSLSLEVLRREQTEPPSKRSARALSGFRADPDDSGVMPKAELAGELAGLLGTIGRAV